MKLTSHLLFPVSLECCPFWRQAEKPVVPWFFALAGRSISLTAVHLIQHTVVTLTVTERLREDDNHLPRDPTSETNTPIFTWSQGSPSWSRPTKMTKNDWTKMVQNTSSASAKQGTETFNPQDINNLLEDICKSNTWLKWLVWTKC